MERCFFFNIASKLTSKTKGTDKLIENGKDRIGEKTGELIGEKINNKFTKKDEPEVTSREEPKITDEVKGDQIVKELQKEKQPTPVKQ